MSKRPWILKKLGVSLKSDFFRNVLTAFSGSAGASVISLLLTPIITRLFDPEDFGQIAFLIVLTTNLGMISTMAYPQAIVLPKSRSAFYQLIRLILILLGIMLVVISIVVFFAAPTILDLFNMERIGGLIYLLPLLILLNELNRIGVNWNIRRKRFRANAAGSIANNLSLRVVQISYAYLLQPSLMGLLSGNLTAYVLRLYILFKGQWREFIRLFFRIRMPDIKAVAKQFQNYPKWMFPSALVEAVSASMPIYILAIYFDAAIVGHFSFAQSLLNHPYTMLSASVMPVFLQRANELYQEGLESLQSFALKIYQRLTILGAVVFGGAVFFSEDILPFIFGSKWETAGVFAGSLAIYFVFKFIMVPIRPIFRVIQKEKYDLIGSGSVFVFRVSMLLIGVWYFTAETTILLFSLAGALACIINIFLIFRLLKMPVGRILLRTFVIFGVVFLGYWGVKSLLVTLLS